MTVIKADEQVVLLHQKYQQYGHHFQAKLEGELEWIAARDAPKTPR
jgi:hypothetical protein